MEAEVLPCDTIALATLHEAVHHAFAAGGLEVDGELVAVDAGETPCRDASTIVSFQHGGLQILRQGALPASEIERVLSDPMQ